MMDIKEFISTNCANHYWQLPVPLFVSAVNRTDTDMKEPRQQ